MNLPTEPTNDVPLTSAEIAGFMNWRGPGAYTVHAERRIRKLVAEAVRREREACAKVCDSEAGRAMFNWNHDIPANQPFWNGAEQLAGSCADTIRARGQE